MSEDFPQDDNSTDAGQQHGEGLPLGESQTPGDVAETAAEPTLEQLREQAKTRANKLFRQVKGQAPNVLSSGNTPEDSIDLTAGNDAEGLSQYKLTHKVEHEDGGTEWFMVAAPYEGVERDKLTVSKIVKRADGSSRTLEVGWGARNGDIISGRLTRIDEKQESYGSGVALNPNQIQATLEVVLGDLQATVDAREMGSASAIDAEVADILGLNLQTQ